MLTTLLFIFFSPHVLIYRITNFLIHFSRGKCEIAAESMSWVCNFSMDILRVKFKYFARCGNGKRKECTSSAGKIHIYEPLPLYISKFSKLWGFFFFYINLIIKILWTRNKYQINTYQEGNILQFYESYPKTSHSDIIGWRKEMKMINYCLNL